MMKGIILAAEKSMVIFFSGIFPDSTLQVEETSSITVEVRSKFATSLDVMFQTKFE